MTAASRLFPRPAPTLRRPVVLVDVDDVLCNFVGKLLALYNADHGTAFTPEDLTTWDMAAVCGPQIYDYFTRPGLFGGDDMLPMPGAKAAMGRLSQWCDLYALTSLPPKAIAIGAARDRNAWCRSHFPMLKGTIIAAVKSSVWGDVLLDDKPSNLEGGAFLGVLMDRPHNRDYTGAAPRVMGWDEAEQMITFYLNTAGPVILTIPAGWGASCS